MIVVSVEKKIIGVYHITHINQQHNEHYFPSYYTLREVSV